MFFLRLWFFDFTFVVIRVHAVRFGMSFLERDRPIDHWQEEHDGNVIDKIKSIQRRCRSCHDLFSDWQCIATLTYICPNDFFDINK
jgi:hypothetical protein